MSEFKIKTAFITLNREIEAFLRKDIGSSLSLFGLSESSLQNFNNLPMIIELAKDVISRVQAQYGPKWNDGGWFYWDHAKIIYEQITILEPIAKEMIDVITNLLLNNNNIININTSRLIFDWYQELFFFLYHHID